MTNDTMWFQKRATQLNQFSDCICIMEHYTSSHRELGMQLYGADDGKLHAYFSFQDVTYLSLPTSFSRPIWQVDNISQYQKLVAIHSPAYQEDQCLFKISSEGNMYFIACAEVCIKDESSGCWLT